MFTKEQILEIQSKLEALGMKDSQLPEAEALTGKEEAAVLQDQKNVRLSLSVLSDYVQNQMVPVIEQLLNALEEDLLNVLNGDTSRILNAVENLSTTVGHYYEMLNAAIGNSEDHVKDHVDSSLNTLYGNLENLLESLQNGIDNLLNEIRAYYEEEVLLTVTCLTPDSQIKINGEVRNSISVTRGTAVSIKISSEGFSTFNEVLTVNSSQILQIELDEASEDPGVDLVNFKISPSPSDSSVTINGVSETSLRVEKGSLVYWRVSREGYVTKEGNYTVLKDTDLLVTLEEEQPSVDKVTLTVNTIPENAVVELNSETRNSIEVDKGASVHIKVSCEGYLTHEEDYPVNESVTKTITLTQVSIASYNSISISGETDPASYLGETVALSASANVTYNDGSIDDIDVTDDAEWSVEGEGCSSNGGGLFTWEENRSDSDRNVTVTVSLESLSQTQKISQEAGIRTYGEIEASMTYEDIPASGGTVSPDISYSQKWGWNGSSDDGGVITSGADITFSGGGVAEDGSVTADSLGTTVKDRTQVVEAVADISLNGETKRVNAQVWQAANTVTYGNVTVTHVSPVILSYEGGTYTLNPSGSQGMSYDSGDTDVLTLNDFSYSEQATAEGFSLNGDQVTAEQNPGTSVREGCTIRISAEGEDSKTGYVDVVFRQKGSDAYVMVSPDSLSFTASGGSEDISITSNVNWTIE